MTSFKAIRQHLELLQNCGIKELYKKPCEKAPSLAELELKYSDCTLCPLHTNRIKFVYGSGDPNAKAMLIGEGPGEQENLTGKPFVGKGGELLDKMLKAINLHRSELYIANIVKCRPPANRNPETEERLACLPYLIQQIEIIQPQILLLLGLVSAQTLLAQNQTLTWFREHELEFMGIPTYVTYHPAALLRNPDWKRPAWEDLQRFQKHYETL